MLKSILLLALTLTPLAMAQHAHDSGPGTSTSSTARSSDSAYLRFKQAMDEGMSTMMRDMHAPGFGGNPDIDFLAMMIPHHEGAIEMARLALVHGRDPATRRLAEEIIASQSIEIEGMRRRLDALRSNRATDESEFPALGGTRGPTQ
jgi:uncharacterized protein (DUF305 family)